ncbi:hypothetical protein GCM10007416_35260 [Kroppenstedtia guangzhouensis]|uniref:CopG-like RHH_1 or ribbon-helix-helix domain-containing protein, RHH_5 n=1 Tax=Kroppenstedtia guangzhouensis TaxID=1274356 RepID=A0ABQ1H6J7_9BACL|nr:hypothetical protein [Kroppenstedtia guangzhouensis]GGA59079.1 hypothetical protein GCM10007416_35260 [Kroppenstedtia guangzhouensis]
MSDKKDPPRLIFTVPEEMHKSLQKVAEEKTEETFGAVKWSLAMVVRTACAEYIHKHKREREKEKEKEEE